MVFDFWAAGGYEYWRLRGHWIIDDNVSSRLCLPMLQNICLLLLSLAASSIFNGKKADYPSPIRPPTQFQGWLICHWFLGYVRLDYFGRNYPKSKIFCQLIIRNGSNISYDVKASLASEAIASSVKLGRKRERARGQASCCSSSSTYESA